MPPRYSFQASKTAPQQAPQPQLASKPAPKQPVPVPDQPQEQGGPCSSTPPSTAPKAKQQSRADADKEARDELMQRRDWSYKDGCKPRWIIYCTTAIAPMIVEGAEIKPAGGRRAPQDHVAVIIPNDQWSPSQQGEEEEEEDDWSEFMPSCQVFSAKSKAYEELGKWHSWWETYEADEIEDLCPDPKTMRMSPSKPPTPKKKKPQRDPPAQPPAPQKETRDLPKLQHQQKHQQQLHKKKRHQPQQQQQHKKTHQPHHKKKRHQRPRHKKEKEQPRKKKRHQKEQPQKATQAHKKKGMQPQLPLGQKTTKKGMQPQLPLGQKTTDPNGRRSGEPKLWSRPLRISLNDSARYTWYSARHNAPSARCKYVARATLFSSVRTCTVAHFSDLSDSVFACVLG